MEHNYFSHREVGTVLRERLSAISEPFDFLDLGSGDATFSVRFLEGTPVKHYEAVDLSEPALQLARENCQSLSCPCRFTLGSFIDEVPRRIAEADVIYIGLSFHHLAPAQKQDFFPALFRALKPGGRLYIYEPILGKGELRETCLQRWWNMVQREWTALDQASLDLVREHVFSSDYPEEPEEWMRLARDAGFATAQQIFTEPAGFYALFEFTIIRKS